jgi:AGZA family xanthine/uracil permease-like MFS transporter
MTRYRWARKGDINAFFGLMLDNVAVMIILVGTISYACADKAVAEKKFTTEFVLTRMIPGTAFGVLLGDLVYTVMAFRLARRTGNAGVTAMPLGLDTPSTFGVALLVLLPSLEHGLKEFHGDHTRAMEFSWHVGLTVLVLAGVFKTLLAPFGNAVRRLVPRAGLLGSLAAIAIALIAFLPMLLEGIAAVPLVGMTTLLIILLTLVAHRELPGRVPGALAAVLLGVAIYLVCDWLSTANNWTIVPHLSRGSASITWRPEAMVPFYDRGLDWWRLVSVEALGKLPVVIPFALATIVGGIDCTESAAAAGDEYDTSAILMAEGLASLAAGLLGGVLQTTPYIGHPAYKKMGGAAAYTLATALFVGAAGFFGAFPILFEWLPQAAMFPILVFVGLEITAQSFHATPVKHFPALAFAMLPALAYLITIPVNQITGGFDQSAWSSLRDSTRVMLQTLRCLANGFIVTSLLWAAALAMILDGRLRAAAVYFLIAGGFAFFGVIHSPLPSEEIGLPYPVLAKLYAEAPAFASAAQYQTPYHWAGAYGLVALALWVLAYASPNGTAPPEAQVLGDYEEIPAAVPAKPKEGDGFFREDPK